MRFARLPSLGSFLIALTALACSSGNEPGATTLGAPVEEQIVGDAELSCAVGTVCDDTAPEHDYSYFSPRFNPWIEFSFAPRIVDGYSLEAFRADFVGVYVTHRFDDGYVWGSDGELREVTFDDFTNGVLSGSFDVVMTGYADSPNQACHVAPNDGTGPDCRRAMNPAVPLHVDFALRLPGPEVVTPALRPR